MGNPCYTWKEALEQWDSKEPVFSIELGGAGPSYEQAMHIAVFESLRRIGDLDPEILHKDTQLVIIMKAIRDASVEKRLRLSEAQIDRTALFVYQVLNGGWAKAVTEYETDRRIQVVQWWPGKG